MQLTGLEDALHEKPQRGEEASAELDDVFKTFRKQARTSKEPHRLHAGIVLAATEEVILEKGLDLVPAAYFGAFLTSLENYEAQDQQMVSATCHLLAMVFPKVSKGVLRARIKGTVDVLQKIHAYVSESAPGVKAVIECFGCLLLAMDSSAWSQPIVLRVYQLILSHCTDSRPKIRKRAHAEIRAVLGGLQGTPPSASVAQSTLHFCSTFTSKCSERNALDALHILGLHRLIMPILPSAALRVLLKELSRLLSLKIAMVTQQVLLCLMAFVEDDQHAKDAETATKILNLASELDVPHEDMSVALPYLQLVTHAAADVARLDASEMARSLSPLVGKVATFFGVEQEKLLLAARDALIALVGLISSDMLEEYASGHKGGQSSSKRAPTHLERLIAHLESLLKFRYKHAWDAALEVYAAIFKHLGRRGAIEPISTLIKSAAELYDTADFHFKEQLSTALGSAIAALGPTRVLALLPFNLETPDGEIKFSTSRVWLIKLLRENVQKGELSLFSSQILPLAMHLRDKANAALADSRPIEAKNLMIVYSQLWELWPAFCNLPLDCAEVFPKIAKNIGMTLERDKDLVPTLCTGLATLINNFKDIVDADISESSELVTQEMLGALIISKEAAQQAIQAIARFSQQFITVLFNVFSTLPADKRGPVFDAICAFTRISPATGVNERFRAVLQKLAEAEVALASMDTGADTDVQKKEKERDRASMLMDLALAFVSSLDETLLQQLYKVLVTNFSETEAVLQKKAYKVLGRISQSHPQWIANNIEEIQEMLVQSMPSCSTSAKKGRLKCLHLCMASLKGEVLTNFLGTLLGEVILATKEVNHKSREAAYNLLITAGSHMEEQLGDEGLQELLKMVTAGLAGSHPHMVSASVQALSRLLYEYYAKVPDSICEHIQNIILLFDHKSREIVSAALGFIKVAVVAFPSEYLQDHLENLLQRLTHWSKDSKNHFRIKIRVIIERLYRKFGLEALEAVFPQEHIGLLRNIRKSRERQVKAKAQMTNAAKEEKAAKVKKDLKGKNANFERALEDSDGDDDNDDELAPSRKAGKGREKGGRRAQATIKQSADGDPMDLLSHSGRFEAARASGSSGQLSRKPRKPFQTNEDGKIVVPDESDEEDLFPSKNGKRRYDEGMDVDLSEVLRAKRSGREIKKRVRDDYDASEDREKEEDAKPKGGQFTFQKRRRVGGKSNSVAEKHSGAEYKGKKAPGDVSKSNRMQPYAYFPLGTKAPKEVRLKKGKMSGIVKGAMKGSRAGKVAHNAKRHKPHKK